MHSQDQVIKGPFKPAITVVGVGGAGGNAVNNMIASKLDGVTFMTCNTDAQALENSLSTNILQLGSISTGGLGAGARPEIGRAAAEESLDQVMDQLADQNMVFITAGMGGGTGTGAAPVIAQACKERGILTVGVVTKPFQFEGAQRMRLAEEGVNEMAQYVDTLIVIPNQNLFRLANEKTTFADAFCMADNVLLSGVKGVADLMVVPGMINLDFADIRSATSEMGKAMMGTGEASGDNRAIEAAEQAINNPLLDDISMKGARSVIINVCGGHDLTLFEIEEASNRITEEVDPDATIIFGTSVDDSLEGSMRITVVATGIEDEINRRVASRSTRSVASPMAAQPRQTPTTPHAEEIAVNTAAANVAPVDSFSTRYPEPSRVQQTASPLSHQTTTATTTAQPMVNGGQIDQNQQTAAASMTGQITPEIGAVETQYVAEGSAIRKIDNAPEMVQPQTHAQPNHNSVIPPFAPARQETVQTQPPVATHAPQQQPTHHAQGYHAQTEQKKTPSLFERITGRSRHVDVNNHQQQQDDDTTSSSSGNAAATGAMPAGLTATRKTVATAYDAPTPTPTPGEQGTLNIDPLAVQPKTPSSSGSSDDLDIPAFLRRQIS